MVEFFRFLKTGPALSYPAILGYRSAINQVMNLGIMDRTKCKVLTRVLRNFKNSYSPADFKVPEWDLLKILQALSKPPFEPLKETSFRILSVKTTFLLALAS